MTQTSKTSWGAKYSAKRITNTCKTPDEAAHAYDMYLKTHYPQKYSKFANFCEACGRFVNPLGLPEYKNECGCTDRKQYASPTPGDVTSPESSTAGSPVSATSSQRDGDAPMEQFRGSNLSIGSMKFSFSDDTEKFFDESFDMVASFETSQQQQPQQQDPTYPGYEPSSPVPTSLQKRDSLPIAVISSAVESFTQEDNLDRIIEDINRPSATTASTTFAKPPQQQQQMASVSSKADTVPAPAVEPTSSSSTYVDFSMDELQDLSEYFLADQFVPPESMLLASGSGIAMDASGSTSSALKQNNYKKIHSLDFDSPEYAMDMSDGSSLIKQEKKQHPPHVLLQTSSMQDIDAIANSFMHPSRPHAVPPAAIANAFPAVIDIETPFLEKYWRNDRKNIQCFPYCPEHGDYYRVRIQDLQHRCKGVCRAAVKARITIPTAQPLLQQNLLVLARCNSTFSRNVALSSQAQFTATEMKTLQTVSAVGAFESFTMSPDGSSVVCDVTFYPDVWKFEFDLPKKRRNISSSSPVESSDVDHLGSEFLYFFEIDVFYATEPLAFERLGHTESMNFQIGNTRTLLRQRNKMTEDASNTPTTAGDVDSVLDIDALPEKKKIKVRRGQLARSSLSTVSTHEDIDASLVGKIDGKSDAISANNYITGEGISSSSSARRADWVDPKKPMDVDQYFRMDSKDSLFHMDINDGAPPTPQSSTPVRSANYNPYLSPKPKDGVAVAAVPARAASRGTNAYPRSAQKPPTPATESYSLAKLAPYTLVCVLLSIVYVPVALLLLFAFVVLPPVAPSVVRVLDTLSDADLRNANSSCISSDSRRVLNRVTLDPLPANSRKLFRYHASGAVWARFAYFAGVKLLVSVVAAVPTLVLSLLSLLVYPIRSLSLSLNRSACSCALWTREYTRSSVGKPFASASGDASVQDDAADVV